MLYYYSVCSFFSNTFGLQIRVSPAAVQASLITVNGYSGSLQAVQGQLTAVPLDLYDIYNNPIASVNLNISSVSVTVAIILGGVAQPVPASLSLLHSSVPTASDVVVLHMSIFVCHVIIFVQFITNLHLYRLHTLPHCRLLICSVSAGMELPLQTHP